MVLVIEGEDRTPQSPCSFQFHFFFMNSVHININKNWVPFLLLTCLAFVSFPGSSTGRRRQRSSFSLRWSHCQNSVLSHEGPSLQHCSLTYLERKYDKLIHREIATGLRNRLDAFLSLNTENQVCAPSSRRDGPGTQGGGAGTRGSCSPLPGVRWHLLTPESH